MNNHYKYIKFVAVEIAIGNKLKNLADSLQAKNCTLEQQILASFLKQRSCFRNTTDTTEDYRERLQLFFSCLEEIRINTQATSQHTLKIILFPEFLFRPFFGAYTLEQTEKITTIIRVYLNNPLWKNYLIFYSVFCAAKTSDEFSENKLCYELYNFCYIQKGNFGIEGSRLVMKERQAHNDTLPQQIASQFQIQQPILSSNSRHLFNGKFINLPHASILNHQYGVNQEKQKNGGDNSGRAIFSIDDIEFAVEICLDHIWERLRCSPNSGKQIQIQIIPSAGVIFKKSAVMVRNNGFVFGNDSRKGAYLYKKNKNKLLPIAVHASQTWDHPNTARLYSTSKKINLVYYKIQTAPPDSYMSALLEENRHEETRNIAMQKYSEKYANYCTACKKEFYFWDNPYHCHHCGYLFCNTCTPTKKTLVHLRSYTPQRVCTNCNDYLNLILFN